MRAARQPNSRKTQAANSTCGQGSLQSVRQAGGRAMAEAIWRRGAGPHIADTQLTGV